MLRTHKLGEADRIITLLTRSTGGCVRSRRAYAAPRSRWGSRLEPFTHVDLQLAEGRNLDTITQAETLTPFSGEIGLDYERYTAGTVMLETADRLVVGGAAAVAPAVPAARRRAARDGVGGARTRARCSTPTCCGRWPWPATRRRSSTARAAATRARTGGSTPPSGGVLCATCRVPGSASPAPETIAVLGALLAGDWPAVEAADPRHLKEASGVVAAYLAWHLERGLRSFDYLER